MIPERFTASCEFCKQPIDIRAKGVHQLTTGWVEKRSAGGAHAISLPTRLDHWAHGPCVRAAAPAPEQLSLW